MDHFLGDLSEDGIPWWVKTFKSLHSSGNATNPLKKLLSFVNIPQLMKEKLQVADHKKGVVNPYGQTECKIYIFYAFTHREADWLLINSPNNQLIATQFLKSQFWRWAVNAAVLRAVDVSIIYTECRLICWLKGNFVGNVHTNPSGHLKP